MSLKKKFSNLSFEELIVKQITLFNWQKIFTVVALFSILNILYDVYKKNKIHPFLILGCLFFIINDSSNPKKEESEIENRKN